MDDMLKARLERAATMQGRYLELATKLGRPPTEDELNFFDHNGGHVFDNEVEEIEDSYRRDTKDWMHGKPLPPRSIKRSASFSPEIRSRVENIAKSNDIKKFWPFKRRKELTPDEAEMALIRFDMATGMSDDDPGWKDYLERHPTLKRDIEAADAKMKAKKEETSSKKASASFSPETRSRILKSANRQRIISAYSSIKKGRRFKTQYSYDGEGDNPVPESGLAGEDALDAENRRMERERGEGVIIDDGPKIITRYLAEEGGDPIDIFMPLDEKEQHIEHPTVMFDATTEGKPINISKLKKETRKKMLDIEANRVKEYEKTHTPISKDPFYKAVMKYMGTDAYMATLAAMKYSFDGPNVLRFGQKISFPEEMGIATKLFRQLPADVQNTFIYGQPEEQIGTFEETLNKNPGINVADREEFERKFPHIKTLPYYQALINYLGSLEFEHTAGENVHDLPLLEKYKIGTNLFRKLSNEDRNKYMYESGKAPDQKSFNPYQFGIVLSKDIPFEQMIKQGSGQSSSTDDAKQKLGSVFGKTVNTPSASEIAGADTTEYQSGDEDLISIDPNLLNKFR